MNRGRLTLELGFLENWGKEVAEMNRNKQRGHPYKYPESLFEFLGYLHVRYRMSYREIEGFLRELSKLVPSLQVPDYTTVCRRVNKLKIKLRDTVGQLDDEIALSVDSSGMKVTNRGDWMRKKWKTRKGWIKVHIAVDQRSKQVLAIEVTDERVGDSKKFNDLITAANTISEKKGAKITRVNADGAYDVRRNFDLLAKREITPAIKIRRNASSRSRGSPARRKCVQEYRELGYEKWKQKYDYGQRWAVEGTFSSIKRIMGENIVASKTVNMFHETQLKFLYHNVLLSYDETGNVLWVK